MDGKDMHMLTDTDVTMVSNLLIKQGPEILRYYNDLGQNVLQRVFDLCEGLNPDIDENKPNMSIDEKAQLNQHKHRMAIVKSLFDHADYERFALNRNLSNGETAFTKEKINNKFLKLDSSIAATITPTTNTAVASAVDNKDHKSPVTIVDGRVVIPLDPNTATSSLDTKHTAVNVYQSTSTNAFADTANSENIVDDGNWTGMATFDTHDAVAASTSMSSVPPLANDNNTAIATSTTAINSAASSAATSKPTITNSSSGRLFLKAHANRNTASK